MRDPPFDAAAQPLARLGIAAEIHRHGVRIRPRPVGPGVVVVHDVHLAERLRLQHGSQRRQMHVMPGMLLRLDHFRVGQQQAALMHAGKLAAIEQFGGAQGVRVLTAFQRVAQDQMAKLGQENRRQVAGAVPGQREIHRFQRRRGDQPVAKRHHEAPVLARVGIDERGDLGLRDRAQRVG